MKFIYCLEFTEWSCYDSHPVSFDGRLHLLYFACYSFNDYLSSRSYLLVGLMDGSINSFHQVIWLTINSEMDSVNK